MKLSSLLKHIFSFFAWFLAAFVYAATTQPVGFGGVAENLLEPVVIISNFVASTSIIIGGSCLFAALIRYLQHRVNPLAHPISSVIILLIMGIVLVCLPLAYKITENGIPFIFG